MNDLNATENPAKGFVQISDDEILRIFSYLWFHDLFRASAASYRLRKLVIGNKSLIFTLLVNQLSHCGVKNVNFEGLVTTLSAECHEILHLCSRMSYWPTDADKNLLKFNLEEVNVNGQTSLCIAYTGRVLGNNRSFVANHHFPVLKSHMREAAAQAKTGNGTGNKGRKVDQKEFEYPDSAIMSGKLEIPTISSYPFTKVVYDPVQECTVPVLSSIAYYEVTIHPVGMSSSRQNRSNWIDARRVQNGDMTTAGTGTSSSSSTSSNTRITTVDNTPLSSFNPCVAIGIANPLHNMRHMPGWNANSFGFHGDDGMFFHRSMNQGTQFTSEPHDAMFGVGDTVGFGIIYPHCPPEQLNNWGMKYNSVTQLFLTKNGNYVGKVNEFDANFDKYPWFPCVGTDSHSALEMNFGNKGVPFQFDIQLFESEVLQWMQRQAERIGATMGPAGKKQSQSTTSVAAEEPVRKVSKPTGRTKPQQGSSVEIPVNIFHPPSSQTMAVDSDLRSCDSTVSATGATSATSDATVANAATSAANGGEYNSKLSAEELAFKTVSHEGRNVSYYTNKTSDSATSSSSSSSSSSQPADHNLMQFFPDIPKPSPLPFLSPYRRISAAATSVGRGSAISTSTTTRASSSSSSSSSSTFQPIPPHAAANVGAGASIGTLPFPSTMSDGDLARVRETGAGGLFTGSLPSSSSAIFPSSLSSSYANRSTPPPTLPVVPDHLTPSLPTMDDLITDDPLSDQSKRHGLSSSSHSRDDSAKVRNRNNQAGHPADNTHDVDDDVMYPEEILGSSLGSVGIVGVDSPLSMGSPAAVALRSHHPQHTASSTFQPSFPPPRQQQPYSSNPMPQEYQPSSSSSLRHHLSNGVNSNEQNRSGLLASSFGSNGAAAAPAEDDAGNDTSFRSAGSHSGSTSTARPPSFSNSVKRSTRFLTAVPAAEVLIKVETILNQVRCDRTETPIGVIGRVELNWTLYRLEVWSQNDVHGPPVCSLQLYQMPPSMGGAGAAGVGAGGSGGGSSSSRFSAPATPERRLSASAAVLLASSANVPIANHQNNYQHHSTMMAASPSGASMTMPQQQQLFLVEFVRGQLEIFAFKRFYQWVRLKLSELVKRDYAVNFFDQAASPKVDSYLLQRLQQQQQHS